MTSRSLGLVVTLGLMVPGCSHHRGDGAEHPGASRTAQTGHPALSKPCPGTEPRSQPSEPPTTGTAPVARTVPPVATTPQSDFVAIVSEAGGARSQLVVVEAGSGRRERVLVEFNASEQPIRQGLIARSPDGSSIYYATSDSTAPQRGPTLWRISAAGGDPTPVMRGRDPALSPDGRYLAFVPDQLSVAVLDSVLVSFGAGWRGRGSPRNTSAA